MVNNCFTTSLINNQIKILICGEDETKNPYNHFFDFMIYIYCICTDLAYVPVSRLKTKNRPTLLPILQQCLPTKSRQLAKKTLHLFTLLSEKQMNKCKKFFWMRLKKLGQIYIFVTFCKKLKIVLGIENSITQWPSMSTIYVV